MKTSRIPYPWSSTVAALLIIGWQLFVAQSLQGLSYSAPPVLLLEENLFAACLILLLLILFDITRFFQAHRVYRNQLTRHQAQISDLFSSKRKLGTRAQTYSDHAEKLKLFISDRLLEYMEYDEKFLHFKNIASEVRHNGVISYDKVQTALKLAAQTSAENHHYYDEASASMLYLWDLLDLSTTDNIALHIANQVYDCEEYYFQSMLNHSDNSAAPFVPSFRISHALHRALLPLLTETDQQMQSGQLDLIDLSGSPFHLQLNQDGEMLGNENHMVLLIENLLNNALFYSDKRPYRNCYRRVVIALDQTNGAIELTVYNHGPQIKAQDQDRIYQLGYSSRRIREHHGKGLGLYFVNEIAKGFEGSLRFQNISNNDFNLSLRVELSNGDIHSESINVAEINGRPMCRIGQTVKLSKKLNWSFASPIISIEVGTAESSSPIILDTTSDGESLHYDSSNPLFPQWVFAVNNRSNRAELELKPLNVSGVSFIANFPSAQSRLESQEQEVAEGMASE